MDVLNNAIEGLNFFTKKWGWEYWFANNELYCGKQLFVRNDIWSSDGNFHYHKDKDETFFIVEGTLILDICDYADEYDQVQSISLGKYQSYRVKPFTRHRFTGNSTNSNGCISNGCIFIEASTHHEESDSYRCYWDLKDRKWVDYDPKTLTKGKKGHIL